MTVTPNKGYTLPVVGSNPTTWGTLLNLDFSTIDLNLGGFTAISVAGAGPTTLTTTQAANLGIQFTGALTANSFVFMPASGGFNFLQNATTGTFTLTIQTAAGGSSLVLPQGQTALFFCDGLNELSVPLTMPNGYILANTSGANGSPTGTSFSALLDTVFGAVPGGVIYRGASTWAILSPQPGYYLQSQSTGPVWAAGGGGGGGGGITQINTGTGLTGGPANSSNPVVSFSLAPISGGAIVGNNTSATAAPSGVTLTSLMDQAFSSTQGSIVYRSGTAWVALAPGSNGSFLQTSGVGGNLSWSASAGTVSNIATGTGLTGGPITSTGSIGRDPVYDELIPIWFH